VPTDGCKAETRRRVHTERYEGKEGGLEEENATQVGKTLSRIAKLRHIRLYHPPKHTVPF